MSIPTEVEHPRSLAIKANLTTASDRLGAVQAKLDQTIQFNGSLRWWDRIPLLRNKVVPTFWMEHERDFSKRQFEMLSSEADKKLPELAQIATDAVGYWPAYVQEQQRLGGEVRAETHILEPVDFIRTYEDLLYQIPQRFRKETGQIAGIFDFFMPRSNGPIEAAGLESLDHPRQPRMDIGMDKDRALVEARNRDLDHLLRLRQTLRVSPEGSSYNIDRKFIVAGTDEVFIPISSNTALTLAHAGKLEPSIGLYEKGAYKDCPSLLGTLDYKLQTQALEAAAAEPEEADTVSFTLSYERVDMVRQSKAPINVTFTGNDLRDAYQKALGHLINLEMDDRSMVVAQGTKVIIGSEELEFGEFEQKLLAN